MPQHRLKTDFRYTLTMTLGLVGMLAITPFAIWRWVRQEYVLALLDTGLLAVIATAMIWGWRGGPIRYIAYFATLPVSAFAAVISLVSPESGYYWVFIAILTNAMLLPRVGVATMLSLAVVGVALLLGGTNTAFHMTTVAVTLVMTVLFSWVFASRAESQRRQLESLAMSDPLTGLDNRRAFEQAIAQALHEAKDGQQIFGLALLDLDGFKEINDTHGHEAGDAVLRQLSRLISDYLRASDRLFRIGGEEFVLLLPGADINGMRARMENLRGRIESNLQCRGEPVTASIGASGWQPGDTATSWLMRADAAMYRAKHKGRNRVIVHELSAAA
ncbi:MAG: GGDEF domain-containing protein [Xanthomonadaceae bacterium]|nr:GGDEF domain-containing protein [Xanthomonadaceae bacterium]